MASTRLTGIIAAAATPIREDNSIDLPRLTEHCRQLLAHGCDGINLLGTTGEATSFSKQQRLEAMETVAKSGLPRERFMVGTGAAAIADAADLTAAARDLGFAGALLLPPFYYKGIDDQSVVEYVEAVMARVGRAGLRLYLYHFPQNSAVPYSPNAVEKLHTAHPEQILGVKDSSGDLAYAAELTRRMPKLDVFPSAEGALAKAKEHRFAGCISATANITGPFAQAGWRALGTDAGARGVEDAAKIRGAFADWPLIAGVKWALSDLYGDAAWIRMCPPLRALTPTEQQGLRQKLAATRYSELNAKSAA
ncbi:MAG TPA: dihydrodipicolinate synthase family protein [Alphaproteobacteria bacterium]